MIIEVCILTMALALASFLNFFIVAAIARSIVETNDEQEELKPYPYSLMSFVNAMTWLVLSTCFTFLGFLIWKSMHPNMIEMGGFILPMKRFLSNAFQGHHMVYPIFLGIATIAFVVMTSLIAETSADIPINFDTSIKFSLVMPHHTKSKTNNGQKVPKEVKVLQLVNLIMIVVSTSIPTILAISL
jgi:hypothetical protein